MKTMVLRAETLKKGHTWGDRERQQRERQVFK